MLIELSSDIFKNKTGISRKVYFQSGLNSDC